MTPQDFDLASVSNSDAPLAASSPHHSSEGKTHAKHEKKRRAPSISLGSEQLEPRTLLGVTASLSPAGDLVVRGDGANDSVSLTPYRDSIRVGSSSGVAYFKTTSIRSISVDLGGGNDFLRVTGSVVNGLANGGSGSDRISAPSRLKRVAFESSF